GGLLFFARAAAATAHRMLLVGVAIGTVFSALVTALAASGDPRLDGLLSWMAGSTLDATPQAAGVTVAAALCALALAPLVRRWLAILPLGPSTAQGLGLPLGGARLCLLLLAAGMTSVATLAVGPFSFVGLMAPHMARMLGLSTPLAQVSGAMLMGAGIMTFADTLGRLVFFPYELPAGLIAACIGAPYLLLALTRQPQGG
ncbi:MAG: Fe3+-hydroxamate ABC transporter permease FhuB, partial [Bradyrhizobium sp. 35-63-5]